MTHRLWPSILFLAAAVHAAPAADSAVRRGDTVLLVTEANGIRLSTPGRALKDGRADDTIPVYNTVTGRRLSGVVKGGWVEVRPLGLPFSESRP